MLTAEIKKLSSEAESKIIGIRREIHKHPELGFNETVTASIVKKYLGDLGLDIRENVAKTGVVGLLRCGSSQRTVAVRADMDALPVTEATNLDYASQTPGVMHACGHDAHTSILLGAAEVLSKLKDRLNGNVKFIFQPAEEGLGGAKYMIEEGVLQSPDVGAVIAAHVDPRLDTGSISVTPGPAMASPGEFEITLLGKGGHAARPQDTTDPIIMGVHLINLLQSIITREINPLSNVVLSVTSFNAGTNFNVIPDKAVIRGTVRTFDPVLEAHISKRIEQLTSSVTKAAGAEYDYTYTVGYPPVVNDKDVVERLSSSAAKVIPEACIIRAEPSMLAEDFSYYAQKVPGAIFNLGTRKCGDTVGCNLHSNKLVLDESCIKVGMQIICQFAVDYLGD